MTPLPDDDDPEPPSRHRALLGLLLIAVLLVVILFVVHRLQDASRMQDCLASGRTNCAPIQTNSH